LQVARQVVERFFLSVMAAVVVERAVLELQHLYR
jgi:hypothetical protein